MHRTIPPLVALLLILSDAVPEAQPSSTGRVTGHVTLTRRVRGTALPSTAYPARSFGRRDNPAVPEILNVVVYVKDPGYRGPLPVRRVEMRQENEAFVPRTLTVTKGSPVDFPNADPFFHNVFSLSGAANFNLGRYPRGQTRSQTFNKPGIVKVYCQIHSHMSATILVLDHPYFTVPAIGGDYELSNLPPGEYTIVGWHERVGERTAHVRVQAGQTASIDLSLPVEESE
jgi:copper binding plastocyanin/azurin family protein